jgi:hypothetical protein
VKIPVYIAVEIDLQSSRSRYHQGWTRSIRLSSKDCRSGYDVDPYIVWLSTINHAMDFSHMCLVLPVVAVVPSPLKFCSIIEAYRLEVVTDNLQKTLVIANDMTYSENVELLD